MMKGIRLCVAVLSVVFGTARIGFGLGVERVGPDTNLHPTAEQPDWPTNVIKLFRHKTRVYSIWVNGSENVYFNASPSETRQLVSLFSEIHTRDHELWIKSGSEKVASLGGGRPFGYNVGLNVPGGISLGSSRRRESGKTHEPTLTIFVDHDEVKSLAGRLELPANIVLHNQVENFPLTGKASVPKRSIWHARVLFDDSTSAFQRGVKTHVTLWKRNWTEGIRLGSVFHDGNFRTPFSDEEITEMRTGESWLTLTVGTGRVKSMPNHPKLGVDQLVLDPTLVQPVKVRMLGP